MKRGKKRTTGRPSNFDLIESYVKREEWLENQLDNMQSTHKICAYTIRGLAELYIPDDASVRHYLELLCDNLEKEAWRG